MPEINWNKLLTLDYWLEGLAGQNVSTPFIQPESFFYWFYLYLFSSLIVAGIVIRCAMAFIHERHPIQKRIPMLSTNVIWIGIVGLMWFLARQTNFVMVGARMWILVLLAWGLIVAYLFIRDMIYFYPVERAYFRKQRAAGVW